MREGLRRLNVHDDPPPHLDVHDAGSLGHYLGWMAARLTHILHGMGELKAEMRSLSMTHNAKERQHDIQTGVMQERTEQRERGEKRLGRWKLRAETLVALGSVATFCASAGVVIGKFVF